jgi:hypothetical protein
MEKDKFDNVIISRLANGIHLNVELKMENV